MKIPDAVQSVAKKHNLENMVYVGTIGNIQVFENDFGLDDQGNPIVAGLPWVITLEGGKAKMLDGVEALHILGRLEE